MMREALRKILAGWHGCFIDFQYWLDLIGVSDSQEFPDGWVTDSADFFNYLGAWLEEKPHSPTPWASSVLFCQYASIQWVKGNGGFILKAAPRNVEIGAEL
ncbi:hypothetical protein QGP82_14695 [Leptothoe sp. LEGE 181152]|nr:hypothetical protein [Leptothoe sp. LEGE 181152]